MMVKRKKNQKKKKKDKELTELGVIKMKPEKKYYPVISANGPCTITVNIGGAPFRITHKEIAKGLL